MNSVATSLVATILNSQVSTLNTNVLSGTKSDQDFSRIFEKVNSSTSETSSDSIADTESADITVSDSDVADGEAAVSQDSQTVETKPKENVVVDDAESVDANEEAESLLEAGMVLIESQLQRYQDALVEVSDMLGITVEELEAVLTDMDMDLLDLGDQSNLTALLQEVMGFETTGELLVDDTAIQVFKDIAQTVDELTESVEDFAETLGVDVEALKEQLQALRSDMPLEDMKEVKGYVSEPVEPESVTGEEGPVLEVVDLREASEKNTEQESGTDQQESRSFGEIIADQLTQVKESVEVVEDDSGYQEVVTKEIMNQVVTKAVMVLSSDNTSVQMQLNPENLGKLSVSVTSEQGVVKGEFVAENQTVKEILEANMIQLKAQLEQQGIKVDKIEVTINNTNQFSDQKQQEQQQSSNGSGTKRVGRISRLMQFDELNPDEVDETLSELNVLEEHTVEYMA